MRRALAPARVKSRPETDSADHANEGTSLGRLIGDETVITLGRLVLWLLDRVPVYQSHEVTSMRSELEVLMAKLRGALDSGRVVRIWVRNGKEN